MKKIKLIKINFGWFFKFHTYNFVIFYFSYNYLSKEMKKNRTIKKKPQKKIYSNEDYNSGDGMLTTVWGPSMWHYLHTMSFNYL